MSETGAIVKASGGALQHYGEELSIEQVMGQIRKVQALMQEAMQDGEHYGKIPGTPKPTLLKAGAEKLCLMFRLDPQYEILTEQVETNNSPQGGLIRYVIRCTLYNINSGNRIASGIGSCSSREEKYGWRKKARTCPNCGAEQIIKGKDEFGGGWLCWKKKGGCGAKFQDGDKAIESQEEGRVPSENIWEQENTILKMAEKRALVAAVLNGTAASDIFTQDIGDDIPVEGAPEMKKVQGKTYVEGYPQDKGCSMCDEPDWVTEDEYGRYCRKHAAKATAADAPGGGGAVKSSAPTSPAASPQAGEGAVARSAAPFPEPAKVELFGFGKKHRDTPMNEVPSGYLRWCLENATALPQPLRVRIEAELEIREKEKAESEPSQAHTKKAQKATTAEEDCMKLFELTGVDLHAFAEDYLGTEPEYSPDEYAAWLRLALLLYRDLPIIKKLSQQKNMSYTGIWSALLATEIGGLLQNGNYKAAKSSCLATMQSWLDDDIPF